MNVIYNENRYYYCGGISQCRYFSLKYGERYYRERGGNATMKLSEMYTDTMTDVLAQHFRGLVPRDKIQSFISDVVAKRSVRFPKLHLRNLYTKENFTVPLDDLPDIVKKEHLCYGANGTLTYDYTVKQTPVPQELIRLMKERKEVKKKELKAEGEENHQMAKYYNNIQNYIKITMNSFYGIQLQKGSFLYNPDTATMITGQARELISEMMWSLERFIMSNLQLQTFNELFMYALYCTKNLPTRGDLRTYLTYIPTVKDVRTRFIKLMRTIPNYKNTTKPMMKTLFNFINTMNEEERISFYYKNNLFELLAKNPKIFALVDFMIVDQSDFYQPENIPPVYKDKLALLEALSDEFVITKFTTAKRVHKYLNAFRHTVLISDTDSVMVNMDPWVKLCQTLTTHTFDSFDDERTTFKLVNIMSVLCTHVTAVAAESYSSACNVPQELRSYIKMKNEFLFKRLILYSSTKKNYAAHVRLREGTVVDNISYTGLKLNGSSKNTFVQDAIFDIIENKILKKKVIDPVEILLLVQKLEKEITGKILEGDLSLGDIDRFSGKESYKDIYTNAAGRGSLIWNELYPNDAVNPGEYVYQFSTTLATPEDCNKLLASNPDWYAVVMAKVFGDERLKRYGISKISIPRDGAVRAIPAWLIPFIDTEDLVRKHIQPIVSLIPSIGIYRSRVSSTEYKHSSLIQF